jgi:hypothetical protein
MYHGFGSIPGETDGPPRNHTKNNACFVARNGMSVTPLEGQQDLTLPEEKLWESAFYCDVPSGKL